ncbi:hypothetical protein M758_UG114800 [Ceratodon purpureus]|nr:hypothetical protein M758_UG114800 [Ceratodon purpureus]
MVSTCMLKQSNDKLNWNPQRSLFAEETTSAKYFHILSLLNHPQTPARHTSKTFEIYNPKMRRCKVPDKRALMTSGEPHQAQQQSGQRTKLIIQTYNTSARYDVQNLYHSLNVQA